MTNDKNTPHSVTMANRRQIRLTGIVEVEAFNGEVIVLHTSQGVLTITGENLNVTRLATEAGDMDIDGLFISMVYTDDAVRGKKGRGLFAGLLK